MRFVKWAAAGAVAVLALHAQYGTEQIRQATISGSRGTSGKCTIEVRVDIAAEVDIYGDSGRLRTVAGQPATWTRMECTDPLPYNMSDFQFKGVDGRGQVRLLQDPRNNNGMAVIRIDDPKSGSEGYTFDIEWSGASGGSPTGGFQSGGYRPPAPGASGGYYPGRRSSRAITSEQAIDTCRAELRTRTQRDYNLRDIDITAIGLDTNSGRGDWVTGTFNDRGMGYFRPSAGYRFNCMLDYNSGQVRNLEILRSDGSVVQPNSGTPYNQPYNPPYNQGGYDQNRVFRACQDAVVARTNRDGYQNVNFTSTAIDNSRSGINGTVTATRGPVTDTFDFSCSMDFATANVRNLQFKRR